MHFKNEFFLTDLNRDNSIDIFEFLYSANQNISYKPEDSAAQAETFHWVLIVILTLIGLTQLLIILKYKKAEKSRARSKKKSRRRSAPKSRPKSDVFVSNENEVIEKNDMDKSEIQNNKMFTADSIRIKEILSPMNSNWIKGVDRDYMNYGENKKVTKKISNQIKKWSQGVSFWGNVQRLDEERIAVIEDWENCWFIGDVHADLVGLSSAIRYIRQEEGDGNANVVLLGDLFDDGGDGLGVLTYVYDLLTNTEKLKNLTVLLGNHDDALDWDNDNEQFVASVKPSDFCDELNAEYNYKEIRGKHVINFVRECVKGFNNAPAALFLPDGTMASHAGMPHSDLLENIQSRKDLSKKECVQDFVWTRIHKKAPLRDPNRESKGCELGVQNCKAFMDKASEVLGIPVERIIRGHDHFKERFFIYGGKYEQRVITINNMSRSTYRDSALSLEENKKIWPALSDYDKPSFPRLIKWSHGNDLEIHTLAINTDLHSRVGKQKQ